MCYLLRLAFITSLVLVLRGQGQCQQAPALFHTKVSDGEVYIRRVSIGIEVNDALLWKHADGREEIITTFSSSKKQSSYWSVGAAIDQDAELAFVSGNVLGALEYWRFNKSSAGGWTFSAKAALGSGALVESIEFVNARTFQMDTGKGRPDEFAVTDEPGGEHPLYKHVLKNGVKLETPGVCIGTENSRQPTLRQKDAGDTLNVSEVSQPRMQPKPVIETPVLSNTSLPDSTPWSIILVLIVAACGLLWLLLKRRS